MALTGITINGKHTITDYGLYFTERPQLDPPMAKTITVNVPGADGVIDLTESVSDQVMYENRTLKFSFAKKLSYQNHADFMALVNRDIHGIFVRVELDDDPGWYYEGRASVAWNKIDYWRLGCTITVNAKPYKIETHETTVLLDNAAIAEQCEGNYDALECSIGNWFEIGKQRGLNLITKDIRIGSAEFPDGDFRAFDVLEIDFSDDESGRTVDISLFDADGNHYTASNQVVITGIRTSTGELVSSSSVYLPNASTVDLSKIWRITVKPHEDNPERRLSDIKAVYGTIGEQYAKEIISTAMPVSPYCQIITTASTGMYVILNGKTFLSSELGTSFTRDDFRLIRGDNVVAIKPTDYSKTNTLRMTFRRGFL